MIAAHVIIHIGRDNITANVKYDYRDTYTYIMVIYMYMAPMYIYK